MYLGVGPDQNFSYIAHLRPSLAIVIDIRRENLLLHLLFKALFAEAPTRVEYLAMLTGRPAPLPLADWKLRSIDEIVAYIDRTPAAGRGRSSRDARSTDAPGRLFGVPLDRQRSRNHRSVPSSLHRRRAFPAVQHHSAGRRSTAIRTLRDLLLEVDRDGTRRSYLASEDDFQFVKRLQTEDRIVPIVGDLSGQRRSRRWRASCRERICRSRRSIRRMWSSTCSAPAGLRTSSRISGGCRGCRGSVIVRSVFAVRRRGAAVLRATTARR